MSTTDDKVAEALKQVRSLIEDVVRHEQLRDGLTGLPNDAALTEELESALTSGTDVWCAFVEIDHFKRLNDSYGYLHADEMLKRVASHLRGAGDYFPQGSVAFRAHGDEFYLVGELMDSERRETITANLERIRSSIEGIRIRVAGHTPPMQCTVSVGWVDTGMLAGPDLTSRGMRIVLEGAVAHAKRLGRNRVQQYSPETRKAAVCTVRDNCMECQVGFSVDLPIDGWRDDPLRCPNCGAQNLRPPAPRSPVEPVPA